VSTEVKLLTSTPDAAAGNPVDGTSVVTSQGTVDRPAGIIADPDDANGRAKVKNAAPAAADYGVIARVLLYDASGNAVTLVAGRVPVDGSGVIQPVSAASLPLPAGASTEATLALIKAKTDNLDVLLSTRTKPADVQGIRALTAADIVTAAQGAAAAVGSAWPVKVTDGTNIAAVKAASTAAVATDPSAVVALSPNTALPVGANRIGSVRPVDSADADLTSVKATQTSRAVGVQSLLDAGRAILNAAAAIAGITTVTTEALMSLSVSRDGAATAGATTIAVTANKRLRVTGLLFSLSSNATAAIHRAQFCLRMNPSGAVTAASVIILGPISLSTNNAVAQSSAWVFVPVPDGIEFSGTMQIGLTHVANATTGLVWGGIVGFEY